MKDYYAILEIQRGASSREVKRGYRKLVKNFHPDLHPGDPACRAKIQEINEAHEVLRDLEKRQTYDHQVEQQRIAEERRARFDAGLQEHPFFSYFHRVNEALRKKT